MQTWLKVTLVTIVAAIPAFFFGANAPIGQLIWPPAEDGPEPTDAQLPLFIVLSVIESLAFGLGIAFLAFGWPAVRRAAGSAGLALAMYVSAAWLLVSWIPHTALHIHNGEDLGGLLAIEYGFHVTLQVAAAILAFGVFAFLRRANPQPVGRRVA